MQAHDFDGDGDLDLAVAEFGWRKLGSLFLMRNDSPAGGAPTRFRRKTLVRKTGAVSVVIEDFDGDGRTDIAAAFAQEHEVVTVWLERGPLRWERKDVFAAQHPNWGINQLIAADLDGDGDQDLLLTNGDAMDDGVPSTPALAALDVDDDGALELLTGRFSFEVVPGSAGKPLPVVDLWRIRSPGAWPR